MRVVLSTIGKFHTFHLARQLHRRRALEGIFSGYPRFKLRREELPAGKVHTFPYWHAPYMAVRLDRILGPALLQWWEWRDRASFDRYVAARLPECDVFCGLSSSGLKTAQVARQRHAKYVCDRGSSHIRYQDALMREEYDRQNLEYHGIHPRIIETEETEYALADAITVPSTFALNSFVQMGVPACKLRRVPYGVDLGKFHPIEKPNDGTFRVLFVGGVSVRKGIAYLLDAFAKLQHPRKCLTIVGACHPEVRPLLERALDRGGVRYLGPVPEDQLKHFMGQADAMVLPSIEEGLALVQAQAMACACPVIASRNTGAEDLFTDGVEGFIVPIRDSDAIADRLQRLADDAELRSSMSAAAVVRVNFFGGWNRYGDTMYDVFQQTALA